ncbi:MAG: hypothetical protein IH626_02355 [Rhodospirillales bacterium]|nr:hypothetical protein [Rhodospirillales bacterium]
MQRISSANRVGPTGLLAGVAFGIGLLAVLFWATGAFAGTPAWQPDASERLVKLPSSYLKKAIDRDFAGSELASALNDTNTRIKLKGQTLSDLQAAIDKADGEVKTELRHQFLAEKQEFVKLMGEQQGMRRKQVETQIKLYDRLLAKLDRREAGKSTATAELIKHQEVAHQRFADSVASVDMALFDSSTTGESRYAREYSKNMAAIESLVQAIREHPMAAQTEIDGKAMSKQDYLRQLMAENQADLAILDQEETILGYMAKLVALDAMSLSEDVAGADGETDDDGQVSLSSSVDFFISK